MIFVVLPVWLDLIPDDCKDYDYCKTYCGYCYCCYCYYYEDPPKITTLPPEILGFAWRFFTKLSVFSVYPMFSTNVASSPSIFAGRLYPLDSFAKMFFVYVFVALNFSMFKPIAERFA